MTCPCDIRPHPGQLDIPPGLSALPRQIARFDDWLTAMRAAQSGLLPLRDWSAQAPGDLGTMLLEFWAVVADVQAFYDAVRADEVYLQTANLQDNLEAMIALLGYRPRPAVAAAAWLGFEATGFRAVTLPNGTAFRSGPVGDEPPQVFELDGDARIIPAFGALDVLPPAPATLGETVGAAPGATELSAIYVDPGSLNLQVGGLVIAQLNSDPDTLAVTRLAAIATERHGDERDYARLTFDAPLAISADTAPEDLTLLSPGQTAQLWSASDFAGDSEPLAADGLSVTLAGLFRQIAGGDVVVLSSSTEASVMRVAAPLDQSMTLTAATVITTQNDDGDDIDIAVPPIAAPATRVTFDRAASVSGSATAMQFGFTMVSAGQVASPPPDAFAAAAGAELPFQRPWRFRRRWRERDPVDTTALLVDPYGEGQAVAAQIDPISGQVTLGQDVPALDLAQPVRAYGNAHKVSRGESVWDEQLGFGDGSVASQSLALKKYPLTYLPAPTEDGSEPTLVVRIDGIEAAEVESFFNQPPDARVYTVTRTTDDSYVVTFGDGTRGARLPTGARISADYRFGAGAAAPGPDSITQMVAPAEAVTAVHQPFAAYGGADAEGAEELRSSAPASALLIGRAISLLDFEAAALGQSGVTAAKAVWDWSASKQRPVARIWYAGDPAIAPDLSRRLRALTDISTAIEVLAATPNPIRLSIQLQILEGYRPEDVLLAVRLALTENPGARLDFAKPQIGAPLLRSPISADVLALDGTWSLDGVTVDYAALTELGIATPAGTWFTVDPELGGALVLNGEEGL